MRYLDEAPLEYISVMWGIKGVSLRLNQSSLDWYSRVLDETRWHGKLGANPCSTHGVLCFSALFYWSNDHE